jgi:hypothetical protein
MNADWHREHVLGRKATLHERIAWHLEHRRVCACRPPPASLAVYLEPATSSARRAPPREKRAQRASARETSARRAAVVPKTPAGRAAVKRSRLAGNAASSGPEGRFADVVAALSAEPDVAYGGKGFGSRGLKVNGKLFAMLDTRSELVVKLPRERVSRLIAAGKGAPFETGGGRVMKEWVALSGHAASWMSLAREALRFVRGA